MPVELSKKDKKLARELMSLSVEKEFALGLHEAQNIIRQWEDDTLPAREAYHKLHDFLKDHRKFLAQRYDAVRTSDYVATIAALYRDKVITEEELAAFSDATRIEIHRWLYLWSSH